MSKSAVSIEEFRVNLAEFVSRVMYGKDVVFIKKYNRGAAVLMSLDDYEKLLDPTIRLSKTEWNKEVRKLDAVKRKIPKTDPEILQNEIDRELKQIRSEKNIRI